MTDEAAVLTAPVLATIPRVELGSVGTWDISNIKGWHPTADDFASAVAALDCPAVRRPTLKPGHSDGPGDPTIGLIDNLAMTDDGQTLVGDFVGVPAWLASADTEGRSVIASAYADRSGEWEHNYVCQLGHTHPFVLHAMALLGVERPGIGTLESLYDLFSKAPKKETLMAGAAMASVNVDQIRGAYYSGPAATAYNLWIREMLVDPPVLIVQDDNDSSLLKVPYAIADNEVTFGEPTKVTVEYVDSAPVTITPDDGEGAPEKVAASAPAARFASRTESRLSRPAAATDPAAPADGATTEGGSGVEITNEQLAALRTALGLADDADINTIVKAVQDLKPDEDSTTETTTTTAAAGAAKLPDGVVAIDSERLATLEANSARFAEHLEKQRKDGIAATLNAAISTGRITPANRATWERSFETNPEQANELLESMPANSAVPVSELGHSTEPTTESVRESAAYKGLEG